MGSHALDLVDFLLGPIADVRANVTGPSGSVETKVDMSFSAGALGKVAGKASWNFEAEVAEDVLTITGSDGSVRCPNAMNGRDVLWSRGGRETFAASHPPPDPVQLPLVTSVVDALLDGSECASTAASSTRCSRVMDAALDAYVCRADIPLMNRSDAVDIPRRRSPDAATSEIRSRPARASGTTAAAVMPSGRGPRRGAAVLALRRAKGPSGSRPRRSRACEDSMC